MGNHRFRLSNMMPNAWFYKLKDMGGSKEAKNNNHTISYGHPKPKPILSPPSPPLTQQSFLPNRASYYYSPRLDPPRNSKKRSKRTPINVSPHNELDVTLRRLPPIVTRPARKDAVVADTKRSPPGLRRLRTRAKTPRVAPSKKAGAEVKSKGRLLESFVVVEKSSEDPSRDFEESMREMIAEHGIRKARDLEQLLACYLALNAVEYHDMIVKVFQQIWFDRCLANVNL